jgi:hypothetical protein
MIWAYALGSAATAQDSCEQQKLLPDEGGVGDKFGRAVDFDGQRAVIGAFQHSEAADCAGSAYVFSQRLGVWTQDAELLPAPADPGDWFAWSVAIDGDTILVGASQDDDNGGNAGAVYVFVDDGSGWTLQEKLLASDGAAPDLFGYDVDIDGDVAVIGAPNDNTNIGKVYVFSRSGSTWTETDQLVAPDGQILDELGTSVAIDGDRIATGSIGDDDQGDTAGAVYIYAGAPGRYGFQQKVVAPDGSFSENFGASVAFDGDRLIVGTPGQNAATGAAYLFRFTDGFWDFEQKLLAEDGEDNDQFGESVDVEGDTAVVGAWNDDTTLIATGSVYVFRLFEDTWHQVDQLIASDPGLIDSFGGDVAMRGGVAVIGAQNNDDFGENSGAAYIFELDALADIDCDGIVSTSDLLALLAAWGPCPGCPPADCPEDLDGNCQVSTADLLILLSNWG